jgi:hypothetical protein
MVSSVQRARGPNGALTNARATASVVSYIVEVQCPPDPRSDRHDEVPDADNWPRARGCVPPACLNQR